MYRYYETCNCGSVVYLTAPEESGRDWNNMVIGWRESHRHESRSNLPIGSGYVPRLDMEFFEKHYTPENFDKGVNDA